MSAPSSYLFKCRYTRCNSQKICNRKTYLGVLLLKEFKENISFANPIQDVRSCV